jgi:two-component system, sensor histidine kinase and response regulator
MSKILIIDDEEWLREMVNMALREKGFEVIEAPNGVVGIEMARKELPDLILCDVNMDKVNGYATLSSLRDQPTTASIPFILMTGLADNAGMRHGMELGADDYLPKPFTIDALYAAVEARLKKTQTLRSAAEKKLADLRDNISLMLPHEMRTPLNGILAYGEILAAEAATLPPTEIAEMGKAIYDSGKRLERLIENFLIYAQLELLAADPLKIAALRKKQSPFPGKLIGERAFAQAEAAGRANDLKLQLNESPLPVSEDYLAKIVDEIVQNAFKFSSTGTPVIVSAGSVADKFFVSVTDRGRGFSADHISHIGAYMQFDRKMQEQQGQGLGLSIAKRLVELHGGTLTIQSDSQAGTSVNVKLPTCASPEPTTVSECVGFHA